MLTPILCHAIPHIPDEQRGRRDAGDHAARPRRRGVASQVTAAARLARIVVLRGSSGRWQTVNRESEPPSEPRRAPVARHAERRAHGEPESAPYHRGPASARGVSGIRGFGGVSWPAECPRGLLLRARAAARISAAGAAPVTPVIAGRVTGSAIPAT